MESTISNNLKDSSTSPDQENAEVLLSHTRHKRHREIPEAANASQERGINISWKLAMGYSGAGKRQQSIEQSDSPIYPLRTLDDLSNFSTTAFGDDCVLAVNTSARDLMGLADGVSWWEQVGIPPFGYPRALLTLAAMNALKSDSWFMSDVERFDQLGFEKLPAKFVTSDGRNLDIETIKNRGRALFPEIGHPLSGYDTNLLLDRAYQATIQFIDDLYRAGFEDCAPYGSCTASICQLRHSDSRIRWTVLGDSTLVIVDPTRYCSEGPFSGFRANQKFSPAAWRRDSMESKGGAPRQLSVDPPKLRLPSSDSPGDAVSGDYDGKDGDIVIIASDGVWNKVYERDVMQIIKHVLEKECEARGEIATLEDRSALAHEIAKAITETALVARENFTDNYNSPFKKEYESNWRVPVPHMRPDDVSVVVGILTAIPTPAATPIPTATHTDNKKKHKKEKHKKKKQKREKDKKKKHKKKKVKEEVDQTV